MSRFVPWKHFVCGHLPFPYDAPKWWARYDDWIQNRCRTSTKEEDFTFLLAGHMKEYLQTKDIYAMAVIYEELMENPEGEYLPYSQLTMSQMPFFRNRPASLHRPLPVPHPRAGCP